MCMPLKRHHPGDEQPPTGDCAVPAVIIDWFARLFIAPPAETLINACRSAGTVLFLAEMGEKLQQPDLSRRLVSTLTGKPAGRVEHVLGFQYVTLFDGLAGPASTPPYESFFTDENGRLWQKPHSEMREIMAALGVCAVRGHEPADHLAMQLATLAEALRQENRHYIRKLHDRLAHWVPLLDNALQRVAPASFYHDLVSLLVAFLSSRISFFPVPHANARD